jgi:hypothetical protein
LSISTVLVDVVSVAELDCDPLDDVEPAGVDPDDSVRDPLDLVDVALGVGDGPDLVEPDDSCAELAVALAPT